MKPELNEHECVSDCMGDPEKISEFPDRDQRFAVCSTRCEANNDKHRDEDKKKNNSSDCSCGGGCQTCKDNAMKHNRRSAETQFTSFETNLKVNLIRWEMFEGQRHFVAPVILIKEGVLNGILYTSEELSKFPEAWNGRPVPILHPTKKGQPISANAPEVLERQNVGVLFNVVFEDDALKGEIWLNENKMNKIAPNLLRKLKQGTMIEVSTGLFIEFAEARGRFKGTEFFQEAFNLRPDHLALLPGEIGACSNEDGCGFPRANSQEDIDMTDDDIVKESKLWGKITNFFSSNKGNEKEKEVLDLMEKKDIQPLLVENNNKEENIMEEKVNKLIALEASKFEESDRVWLLKLNEEQLDKLTPEVNDVDEEAKKAEALKAQQEEDEAEAAKVKAEADEKAKNEDELGQNRDVLSLIENKFAEMTAKIPEVVNTAMVSLSEKQEKQTIINDLVRSEDGYEEDDLKGMSINGLKKLASTTLKGVYLSNANAANKKEEALGAAPVLFASTN